MTRYFEVIPHTQTTELRLRLGEQQTSFTLHAGRAIRPKTLAKIEKWALERSSRAVTDQLLAQLRGLSLPLKATSPKGTPPAPMQKPLTTKQNLTVVCDYSAQGSVAVWACVIGSGAQQVMCCGSVPPGENGERYAILRTHHYLQRLGHVGVILSDEKATAKLLSQWYPVGYVDRSDTRHKPAHELAHNFALLLAQKPASGKVAELKTLMKCIWPDPRKSDFIWLPRQGWRLAQLPLPTA